MHFCAYRSFALATSKMTRILHYHTAVIIRLWEMHQAPLRIPMEPGSAKAPRNSAEQQGAAIQLACAVSRDPLIPLATSAGRRFFQHMLRVYAARKLPSDDASKGAAQPRANCSDASECDPERLVRLKSFRVIFFVVTRSVMVVRPIFPGTLGIQEIKHNPAHTPVERHLFQARLDQLARG